MSRDWWVPILQWTFWVIAMTVVMGWMARSRTKPRPQAEQSTLRHPASTLVIGLVGMIFFLALVVVSNTIGRNETTSGWTTAIFLFFGAGSALMVFEYAVARHRMTDDGLHYVPLLQRRGYVRWGDVQAVGHSAAMKWFRLRTAAGMTVRLPFMLMGLPDLARLLLAHVPADRIDAKTQEMLQETAAGKPPSVWN